MARKLTAAERQELASDFYPPRQKTEKPAPPRQNITGKEKTVRFTATLTQSQREKLEALAKAKNASMSAVIGEAIEALYEKQ